MQQNSCFAHENDIIDEICEIYNINGKKVIAMLRVLAFIAPHIKSEIIYERNVCL